MEVIFQSMTKRYLDEAGLRVYDQKIKEYISQASDGSLSCIESGEGENSILQKTSDNSNKALSTGSLAFGINTYAGGKGYKIIATSDNGDGTGTYTLNTVEGIEVGQTYSSVLLLANYQAGTIQSISGNVVTVDGYLATSLNPNTENVNNYVVYNFLLIDGHPELGDTEVGFASFAAGSDTHATNTLSTAFGRGTRAIGKYGMAINDRTVAGHGALSTGRESKATGAFSFATGMLTSATGNAAAAFGEETIASGDCSVAFGAADTQATAREAIAAGHGVKATAQGAAAFGGATTAGGQYAFVAGVESTVSTQGAAAFGYKNTVTENGTYAFAEGQNNTASGAVSHVGGSRSTASNAAAFAHGIQVTASGEGSTAFGGIGNTAAGKYSFVAGEGSVANGQDTIALGVGLSTKSGTNAKGQVVVGKYNASLADSALFAVGAGTSDSDRTNALIVDSSDKKIKSAYSILVNGKALATESYVDAAIADIDIPDVPQSVKDGSYENSTLMGIGTVASSVGQVVVGKYNSTDSTSLFIVGNGSESTPGSVLLVRPNEIKTGAPIYVNNRKVPTTASTTGFSSTGGDEGKFVTIDANGNLVAQPISVGGSF